MRELLRDVEHLVRLAAVFAVGLIVFIVARAAFVPDDFGIHGHYRAGALQDNREKEPVFGGRGVCVECHDDVVEARAGGGHERVGCEACHGALAAHALEPSESLPERPDGARVCLRCHVALSSRPDWFPQVEPEDHAMGDPCNDCHEPHRPGVE